MNGLRARFRALVAQQLRAPLPAGKKGAKDRGEQEGLFSSPLNSPCPQGAPFPPQNTLTPPPLQPPPGPAKVGCQQRL